MLFFLVVALASSLGGWGPGLISAALSSACGWWFLSTSPNAVRADGALVGAAVFLPVAIVIAIFGALVREGFREREIAAGELSEAVRARDEFISTASHELKTPLTALTLVTQQLARLQGRGPMGDASAARLLSSVGRQTSRLTVLVNNLLDVSRIASGPLRVDLEDVDVVQISRDVAERFEGELAQAGSKLSIDAEASIVGHWDRLRLDEMLTNLLSNAVKFGGGRPVSISVHREGNNAVIQVSDLGIGIAPEDRDRIFERFERGPHGQAPGGFGLGLWIVREIATALSGTVEVESAPCRGTTFTVTLPMAGPRVSE